MAARLMTQIWNDKAQKFEDHAAFDDVDTLCKYAQKFRETDGSNRLQVHVPGGFALSPEDAQKINGLGIERF